MNLPNMTTFEMGGVTLIIATYLVLQVLKRKYKVLDPYIPALTVAIASLLVGTYMWVPTFFTFLATTVMTSALIFGAHAVMKNSSKPPSDG